MYSQLGSRFATAARTLYYSTYTIIIILLYFLINNAKFNRLYRLKKKKNYEHAIYSYNIVNCICSQPH